VASIVKEKEFAEKVLVPFGLDAVGKGHAEFATFVHNEQRVSEQKIKSLKIQLD